MTETKEQPAQEQQQVDPATYMRGLSVQELKALHFDLFAQKQRADHLYQMVLAVIGEKQNPEPTKVATKNTKTE